MTYLRMEDLDLKGHRLLIREDFNVPLADGRVTSDKRIAAAIPTIELAHEKGAALILMSHLGRPVEGEFNPEFSLAPVAQNLSNHLGRKVRLERDWLDAEYYTDVPVNPFARLMAGYIARKMRKSIRKGNAKPIR